MKEDTLAEHEIVTRFREGDEDAYASIFNEYYTPICYYAQQIIGDQTEAEDIAVETFLKLHKRYKSFEAMYNVRGFLYLTARNSCYNYLRAKKNHGRILQEILETSEASYEEHFLDEFEVLVIKKLKKAIDELPDECQRMFKMLFYDEMKPKEVASALQVTVEAVRSGKRYALQLLRNRLGAQQLVAAWTLYMALKECGDQVSDKIPHLYP